METGYAIILIITITLSIASLLINSLLVVKTKTKTKPELPPQPFTLPIIGRLQYLHSTKLDLETILQNLYAKLGPIVSLPTGPDRSTIFIKSHSLAHQTLIRDGAIFASRPEEISIDRTNIFSAPYGPTWRLLRRNLTTEICQSQRIKSHSASRRRVLGILVDILTTQSRSGSPVVVAGALRYAMFCLLCSMCFGGELDERTIREIDTMQLKLQLAIFKFQRLKVWRMLGMVLFRKRMLAFKQYLKEQDELLLPLIRARKVTKPDPKQDQNNEHNPTPYVDTLLALEVPEEGKGNRKLDEEEVVGLCTEFLNAGTDSTLTALVWIMANMVKYPHIQQKLLNEIHEVMVGKGREDEEEVEEEDTKKMRYLKAVVLEGLRLHPPSHFVLDHAVTEDVVIDGYLVPKKTVVQYSVAEMGRDPNVWEDPTEFKPERFMGNTEFDLSGSKEIKMMPFGAGRRMCPGYGVALLHLEYYLANLVWKFQWNAVDQVDLSEKVDMTFVMKYPLRAHLVPRFENEREVHV